MKPSRPYHAVTAYHREPGGLRRLDFFIDRIRRHQEGEKEARATKILDVGCGLGNIALPLANLGYRVTGLDLDAASVREARQRAEELELRVVFHEGSLERVAGQKFDVIIASEVLEHQKDPRAFLTELAGLLRPGGIFLLSVPNGTSLEENIRRFTTHTRLGRWLKRGLKKRLSQEEVQSAAGHPHERFFSWRVLRRTLYESGWKVAQAAGAAAVFKEFYYLLGRFLMRRGSRAFHALDGWDGRLAPRLPLSLADGWLIETQAFNPAQPLVMYVVTKLQPGGAERLVYELAKRLPEHGFATHVAAIFGSGSLEKEFRKSGIPLSIIKRRGLFGLGTLRELAELMARERPAIVHTHLFGADVMGRMAAWRRGVAVTISTEHSTNPDHGIVKTMIKAAMSSLTSAFVAVSKDTKKNMVAHDRIPSRKIRVIENGIDLTKVVVRPPGAFHDVPRFITVGRLSRQKDQATLLKALALIKRPWMLQVAGAGELKDDLQRLCERLGIAPRVRWLGYRTDVPQLLADSDVFCFPSKWEGLGLALLEAAAAGVPIVASSLPVFKEVLTDKHAVYVPPADVPAWSRAINAALADPLLAVARAQGAAAVVRQKFSVEKMVARYAGLYHELLKAK